MKAQLHTLWESRAPRERVLVAALAVILSVALYWGLVQSANRARTQLTTAVPMLRAQAARLEQEAAELERLRAMPPATASQTDLRTLVQDQADMAELAHAMTRIDATEVNQVQVVFGAVPFAEWIRWVADLQSQQVHLDTCRIEALSRPGLVSVTATFIRAEPQ